MIASPPHDDYTIGESCDDVHCLHQSLISISLHHDSPLPCDIAPLACETLVEVPCMPHIDESQPFVHEHPLLEPIDLEVDVSIVDESQVHACCVSSIESHYISLSHCDLLSTALPHAQIGTCDDLPMDSFPFSFVRFFYGFFIS